MGETPKRSGGGEHGRRGEQLACEPSPDGRFEAIWLDAGGVLVLPDPEVLGPLLVYYGGDAGVDRHRRAHYAAMAVKSVQGAEERDWIEYDRAYVRSIGVAEIDVEEAAQALGHTRSALLWRWVIPEHLAALRALGRAGVRSVWCRTPAGRSRRCCGDPASARSVPALASRSAVWSTATSSVSPSPIRRSSSTPSCTSRTSSGHVAYVGDSVTMDVGGARAAGLHPLLVDPYDDHPDGDFDRIKSLADLVP